MELYVEVLGESPNAETSEWSMWLFVSTLQVERFWMNSFKHAKVVSEERQREPPPQEDKPHERVVAVALSFLRALQQNSLSLNDFGNITF